MRVLPMTTPPAACSFCTSTVLFGCGGVPAGQPHLFMTAVRGSTRYGSLPYSGLFIMDLGAETQVQPQSMLNNLTLQIKAE